MAITKDLEIKQGKTFSLVIRWETDRMVRKPIAGISLAAGAPRLTVQGHGCPDGWRAAVVMVKGMTQLNALNTPLRDSDFRPVTVIDADTIEFNTVTPVDDSGREWPEWVSGGFLVFHAPHDLAGYLCRMKVKDREGGTVLLSTDAADAPKNLITASVDNAAKTILVTIPASTTAALTWKKGVHEVEMESPGGVVEALVEVSKVTVTGEVAT